MMLGGRNSKAFWRGSDGYGWPADFHGWVFLGRAIHDVGRMMHGSDWRGGEPGLDWRAAEVLGLDLLLKLAPSIPAEEPEQEPAGLGGLLMKNFSRLDTKRPDLTRRDAVFSAIIKGAQAGDLTFAAHDHRTGDMKPCPPAWWRASNTMVLESRLRDCRIDTFAPFDSSRAAFGQWLYVDADDLARLLGARPNDAEGQGDMLEATQEPAASAPPSKKAPPAMRATQQDIMDWIQAHYTMETLPRVAGPLFHTARDAFVIERNQRVERVAVEQAVGALGWTRKQGRP